MYSVSSALTPRFLVVLLAVILVLALLSILLLVQAHVGAMPSLVQSTAALLE